MQTWGLAEVRQAIEQADEQGEPASLFTIAPEPVIWQHARALLDDPEHGYYLGPTLLTATGIAFDNLQDQAAALQTLEYALNPSFDSLVYQAAQKSILQLADRIDTPTARRLCMSFQNGYLTTTGDGDPYIAAMALEGVVMLPIFRQDRDLLQIAIGLLLNFFPSLPDDPYGAAYLPVKALKLVGRCYDFQPNQDRLASKVETLVGARNVLVDAEACFTLGLIRLYGAFQASDVATLRQSLTASQNLFEQAYNTEENRTDAELFLMIVRCYLMLLSDFTPQLIPSIQAAKAILTERALSFGGSALAVEYNLVRLIIHFERWTETLASVEKQPNLLPPLRILADAYAAIREHEVFAGEATRELVMMPHLQGRLAKVQEITNKVEAILGNQTWRKTASAAEITFYELVLKEVSADLPKDEAAARLQRIYAAAQSLPEIVEFMDQLQSTGASSSEIWEQTIMWLIQDERQLKLEKLGGAVRKIYQAVSTELQEKLDWPTRSREWLALRHALLLTVRYCVKMYRATRNESTPTDISFLFAEPDGLGQKATEAHLEGHFYNSVWMYENVEVVRQIEGATPGKPDLLLRYFEGIDFSIEVKREFKSVEPEHIHQSYLAQAQSYAAGTGNRVGFLFVLDLTPKPIGEPLKDIQDYYYLDQRLVSGAKLPDYVVVAIFPANRYLPSAHSWKSKKRGRRIPQK